MKKILILLCLISFTIPMVNGQTTDTTINLSPQALHDMYIKKHQTNNTVGWSLLGGGLVMTGVGSYIYVMNQNESVYSNKTGEFLFYLGVLTTVASIPAFISAGSNKRKAMLALKGETVTIGTNIHGKAGYTALAFTIQL